MRNLFSALLVMSTRFKVRDENTGNLYTVPQDSVNGSFEFPRAYPLTFREGSTINVSWTTLYPSINLYFYQRGKVASSIQIVTNLAINWYQWEVLAFETNLTEPYVFHIVNGHGTPEELTGGGFWSSSYYIQRDKPDQPSAFSSTSSTASSSTPSPTSSTSQPPSTTSLPLLTSNTLASTSSAITVETTSASTQPTAVSDRGISRSGVIGLSIAVSIVFIGIVTCLLLYLKHRRHKASRALIASLPPPVGGIPVEYMPHELYVEPPELLGTRPCYELPAPDTKMRTIAQVE